MENQKDMKSLLEHLSEHEMELDRKDLEEIHVEIMEMSSKLLKTANSLRAAAAKLERVLKGCEMTRIAGTSAVLGGMLIFGGGMAFSYDPGSRHAHSSYRNWCRSLWNYRKSWGTNLREG